MAAFGDGGGSGEGDDEEEAAVVASLAAVAGAPTGVGSRRPPAVTPPAAPAAAAEQPETLVFLLHPAAAAQRQEAAERSVGSPHGDGAARVLLFGSEEALLVSWAQCVRQADPDVLALFEASHSRCCCCHGCSCCCSHWCCCCRDCSWCCSHLVLLSPVHTHTQHTHAYTPWPQVNDTLAVLKDRFAALRLEGGNLQAGGAPACTVLHCTALYCTILHRSALCYPIVCCLHAESAACAARGALASLLAALARTWAWSAGQLRALPSPPCQPHLLPTLPARPCSCRGCCRAPPSRWRSARSPCTARSG